MPAHSESNQFPLKALPGPMAHSQDTSLEKLILDTLPAFIFLLADDLSIQYANVYFNQQFGTGNSDRRCYSTIRRRNAPCNPCPVRRPADQQKEHIWTWEDAIRGQLYDMHFLPCADLNGRKASLIFGMIINKQEMRKKTVEQSGNEDVLRICCHCKNINEASAEWEPIEGFLSRSNNVRLSHGICPDCLQKHYPEVAGHVK